MVTRLLAVMGTCALLSVSALAESSTSSPVSLAEELHTRSSEVNVALPMMVDENTRLMRVSSNEESLIFHYTLLEPGIENRDLAETKARIQPAIVKQTCAAKSLETLMKKGAQIIYLYSTPTEPTLLSVDVSLKQCIGQSAR